MNKPLPYAGFRTGFTFKDIRDQLGHEATFKWEAKQQRMFITRHTVLGRWKQIKELMYNEYMKGVQDVNSSG